MSADPSMLTGSPQANAPEAANAGDDRGEIDETTWSGIAPYLPAPLVDAVRRHPDRGPTWIDFLEGTLLFADVSGFTALSERLARIGKEGVEQLTEVINRYFRRMLDIGLEHGGANLKFGGDAVLLLLDMRIVAAVLLGMILYRVVRRRWR